MHQACNLRFHWMVSCSPAVALKRQAITTTSLVNQWVGLIVHSRWGWVMKTTTLMVLQHAVPDGTLLIVPRC